MSGGDPSGNAEGRAPVVISVCVSCRPPDGGDGSPGDALLAALRMAQARGEARDVLIRPVQCLSVCKRPCTIALSRPDGYTYVFGDLDPAIHADAVLECAESYAAQEHGYLLWRERPGPLRRGIVARIPPMTWTTEDGRHPR
ncbi:DUF1636 family protein [Enterovirga aerilata]|uniref:DUF1636 domain-containing protein n=1 Tax=Enterovirga aerilata TaxID=2730920 RepID=A0A849ID00_9HYPH|nr:DUF1636 domain-containing protein [Enterovirga sp. DB1703]